MGQYTMAGLGAPVTTRQIDPAVPGVITASGGAVRDITGGIADIWRASRGEAAPSDAAADAAADFIDPGASASFWSTTPGHVVIIGGVLLAVTAVGLVAFTKKKERAANRRRRRNVRPPLRDQYVGPDSSDKSIKLLRDLLDNNRDYKNLSPSDKARVRDAKKWAWGTGRTAAWYFHLQQLFGVR